MKLFRKTKRYFENNDTARKAAYIVGILTFVAVVFKGVNPRSSDEIDIKTANVTKLTKTAESPNLNAKGISEFVTEFSKESLGDPTSVVAFHGSLVEFLQAVQNNKGDTNELKNVFSTYNKIFKKDKKQLRKTLTKLYKIFDNDAIDKNTKDRLKGDLRAFADSILLINRFVIEVTGDETMSAEEVVELEKDLVNIISTLEKSGIKMGDKEVSLLISDEGNVIFELKELELKGSNQGGSPFRPSGRFRKVSGGSNPFTALIGSVKDLFTFN